MRQILKVILIFALTAPNLASAERFQNWIAVSSTDPITDAVTFTLLTPQLKKAVPMTALVINIDCINDDDLKAGLVNIGYFAPDQDFKVIVRFDKEEPMEFEWKSLENNGLGTFDLEKVKILIDGLKRASKMTIRTTRDYADTTTHQFSAIGFTRALGHAISACDAYRARVQQQ